MATARDIFDRTLKPPYVAVRGAINRALERRAGIDTEGTLLPDELGFDGQHRERYQPAGWFQLRRILPPREVGADEVFVDIGSGKGRIVYQAAAWYPFKRVIGVELSGRLTEAARANIDRVRHRLRCEDVELVTADVTEYELSDDVTVVYLNNPFNGPVFAAAVGKILASLERRPRRLRVIYGNPVEEQMLLDAGFRPLRRLRGLRPTREWSLSNSVRMYVRGDQG